MRNGDKLWTEADEFMLCSLWRAGYTSFVLADYFKVTRDAILGKLNRLRVLGKPRLAGRTHRKSAKPARSHVAEATG